MAGLLTTEALSPESIALLQAMLRQQPLWSDVPLILLTGRIDSASYAILAQNLGNVTIIGRPLDASSLLTVVETALRARKKQYQIRDLLVAGEKQNAEIRALNERLKRAMTETHHRVKNSLQLISAFVDMQVIEYEESVPTIELKRINSHVRTLAAVHDVLTQETKQNRSADYISIKNVLEQFFPMIQNIAEGKKLRHEIADIRLSNKQGTSLALIANELILNALKHSGNEVAISLEIHDDIVSLTVSDDGQGLPAGFDVLQKSNTGLALVENLAHWDLQGGTRYTNRQDRSGAEIVVTFPIFLEPEMAS